MSSESKVYSPSASAFRRFGEKDGFFFLNWEKDGFIDVVLFAKERNFIYHTDKNITSIRDRKRNTKREHFEE